MCQGFSHFSGVLHLVVLLAKLLTSSIRVNIAEKVMINMILKELQAWIG